MTELENKINRNLKESIKKKDELRSSVLRLLIADMKNATIEKRETLSEEEIIQVIASGVKKRKDAIESYQQGGREDLADKEKEEIKILQTYLPKQLSEEEIKKVVMDAISEVSTSSPADFGKVMGAAMGKLKGKAEGELVSKIVKESLS